MRPVDADLVLQTSNTLCGEPVSTAGQRESRRAVADRSFGYVLGTPLGWYCFGLQVGRLGLFMGRDARGCDIVFL